MTKARSNRFSTLFVSLLTSFVVVAIVGLTFTQTAFAQEFDAGVGGGSTTTTKTLPSKQKPVNSLKQYTEDVKNAADTGKPNVTYLSGEGVLPGIANGITCALTPCDINSLTADTSLTGNMSRMVGYMFTSQPASSYIAVADFMNNAGIPVAEPAYAQVAVGGLGFASLSPILNAWKTFRNIAFLFFVIIILVIGFMIMFRQKVGQAAVTAQQAIPRVIIALVTVSFSYAIAGLLIDAMYILMTLMIYIFGLDEQESLLLGGNAISLGITLVTSGATESFEAIQALVNGIAPINLGVEFLAGWTVGLIVAISIVFAMFRLFFELLKTYVTIIISITIAPLVLMLGAIPGRDVFGKWISGLIGNLAAFPIVLLILILYDQLTGGISQGLLSEDVLQGGFSPPYLFGTIEPGGVAQFFIGMGLLLIMTDLVKQGKKALGADDTFANLATAFGDSLKKGWEGGELVPGLGITDTKKYGLTGKAITRTAGVGASAAAGGALGAAKGLGGTLLYGIHPTNIADQAASGARFGGRAAADISGSGYFAENREERKKTPAWDLMRKARQMSSKEGK
jgi:hypothetical protein